MPLTKGFRDEENERINSILKKLVGMDYVPESELDIELKSIALNRQEILEMSPEQLVTHLQKLHFDWRNAELFADFLLSLSERIQTGNLKEKAISVYNYTQSESKTFSFEIFGKIASAKNKL